MKQVLVTGSAGLIGSAMVGLMTEAGYEVRRFDHAEDPGQELRNAEAVLRAVDGCAGVIHLGALSRVLWGEQRPVECYDTNVGGTLAVLAAAQEVGAWVISASSREVYGQQDVLPVPEGAPLRPCNVYGRSKVAGERLVAFARRAGVRATVVRFSNVYGSSRDHADRVVPAFARAALAGVPLRVDGPGHLFDFTYVTEVVRGVLALAALLDAGEPAPEPVHFVSGEGVTLGELAAAAVDLAESGSCLREAPPRSYDVARFLGDPSRAKALLGWQHSVPLRTGLARLLQDITASTPRT